MHRFFIDPMDMDKDRVILQNEDFKHLRQVLRLGPGDLIGIFDGTGIEYEAEIIEVDKSKATARILTSKKAETEPETRVTLYQGLPKGEKMDLIIQKSVELGVFRVVPVVTKRTVIRLDEKEGLRKSERWGKIAREAAKQCGRAYVPQVTPPVPFSDAVKACGSNDLAVLLYENEEKKCLKELLKCYTINKIRDIALFIGPEGGFDVTEIEFAKQSGLETAWLGKRILRTETAAISVLSIIMYEMGEFQ